VPTLAQTNLATVNRQRTAEVNSCLNLAKQRLNAKFSSDSDSNAAAARARAHACTHARTHTHMFNGPLSGTTRVSRCQKGKTNLDFTEARDSEWQWHQLEHMQVCTSLQTDNHASTLHTTTTVFYRPDALPAAQPTESTESCRYFLPGLRLPP